MSPDAIAIRRAVADTRRAFPAADVENIADYCITHDVPIGVVKAIPFDVITEAAAARPPHVTFSRSPLSAVLGAGRRRA